jgi:hypothetical protein
MARPRVFVSSTYYDLKHIRASLESFIDSLGYDAILSEKGDIAYDPEIPLDESCYREVRNADIFVLIIGSRYGSEKSETKTDIPKGFFDRYDSITRTEYNSAVESDIPVYILIERAVYAEYHTYLLNKSNKDIRYAHVNSVNVFALIEEILAKRRNNPVQPFDRYADIQSWLREQWAGHFRDLLNRTSSQAQIASLASQVSTLTEINQTLKTYLEQVVMKVAPEDAKALIHKQEERLKEVERAKAFQERRLYRHLLASSEADEEAARNAVIKAESLEELGLLLVKCSRTPRFEGEWEKLRVGFGPMVLRDWNSLRDALGLTLIGSGEASKTSAEHRTAKKRKEGSQ